MMSKKIILKEGDRFGKLTTIKENGRDKNKSILWLCGCDCGGLKSVRGSDLIGGHTKSCGCLTARAKDLTGKRFDKIKVIKRNGTGRDRSAAWLCKCDCGNYKTISSAYLLRGCTTHCGCSPNLTYSGLINKHNLPLYKTYKDQLYCENTSPVMERGLELFEVKCTYCDRFFRPSLYSVKNRVNFLKGTSNNESRFYCSDKCKKACPIYGQKLYPKDFKISTSREVQPDLRKMVLKRDNYTCQHGDCGKTIEDAELHCHHIEGINVNPIESADMDLCITLCKKHHKLVHKEKGCRYVDLTCNKIGEQNERFK